MQRLLAALLLAPLAHANVQSDASCQAQDLKHRVLLQNKLAGFCEDMCKEVGAYPKCGQCPSFVPPDPTPGVMTWPELLEHMDNLVDWGHGELKAWAKQAGFLQKPLAVVSVKTNMTSAACNANDLAIRSKIQNKLAGACEDMCKEVGAYPKCGICPAFSAPDPTPGVMTWTELLTHMDNLKDWGQGKLKDWTKQAAEFVQKPLAAVAVKASVASNACVTNDIAIRQQFQNKLAGYCEDMCKEVGAYPKCGICPAFSAPDPTPGVMTWSELLEHMDNLVDWGNGELKAWRKQSSSFLQKPLAVVAMKVTSAACNSNDLAMRVKVQNKLAGFCEDMCKEVGAYPKCGKCPSFVPPDPTPGVMTWSELLEHMDNLVDWGHGELKAWAKQANR